VWYKPLRVGSAKKKLDPLFSRLRRLSSFCRPERRGTEMSVNCGARRFAWDALGSSVHGLVVADGRLGLGIELEGPLSFTTRLYTRPGSPFRPHISPAATNNVTRQRARRTRRGRAGWLVSPEAEAHWLAPCCVLRAGVSRLRAVFCVGCHFGKKPHFSATPSGRQQQLPMHRISLPLGQASRGRRSQPAARSKIETLLLKQLIYASESRQGG
jgi:hypothetical protein